MENDKIVLDPGIQVLPTQQKPVMNDELHEKDRQSGMVRRGNIFLENKAKIERYFDRFLTLQAGGDGDLRKELRAFANNSHFHLAFLPIAYAFNWGDDFLEDFESELGEEEASELGKFVDEYNELELEVRGVFYEIYYHNWNPIGGFDYESRFLTPGGIPLITYWAYSGDTCVLKTREEPAALLNTAATLVNAVARGISVNDAPVPDEHKEDVRDEIKHVKEHLTDVEDEIGDDEEPEEG